MDPDSSIEPCRFQHPYVLSLVKRIWHNELGLLQDALRFKLIVVSFDLRGKLHILVLLVAFLKGLNLKRAE
jgi:hypothetical protein